MLNEEQMKLVEKYYIEHKIVEIFMKKYRLEFSEWHGIVSESLMKAVLAYDESRGKLSSLFYAIARNDVYNERRKKVDLVGITDTIEIQNEPKTEDFHLEIFMDGLDGSEREIVMYLYDGYNYSDIAKLIGVSKSTISRRIANIREKVGEHYGYY